MGCSWRRLGARWLAAALALSASACAAVRPPLTPPELGGTPWRELRSTHFVVETDEDADSARELLLEAERSHAALAYVLRRPRVEVEVPVELIVFARKVDFTAVTPRNLLGYFDGGLALDTEARPVIVVQSSELPAERKRLWQHELTHRILHERFPKLPRWFDEGSAEFYSSLRVEGGEIHLGAPTDLDFSGRPYFWLSRLEDDAEQTVVPVSSAPTLVDLIAADPTEFYSDLAHQGKLDERSAAYYAASWKLVHLLSSGGGAQARAAFEALQGDLERGGDASEAFFRRFGPAGSSLAAAYPAYLRADPVPRTVVAAPPATAEPAIQERLLAPAEVHLLWARLSMGWAATRELARSELTKAFALEPQSPDVLLTLARADVIDGNLGSAKRALDIVLSAHPDDARALSALVDWYRQMSTKQGPEAFKAIPRDVVERLAKNAVSAAQLENAARCRLFFRQLDDALALAQRSRRRDRLCVSCEDAYAIALWELGRSEEARAAIDRAIAIAGEHASLKQLLEHREVILKIHVTREGQGRSVLP